MKSNGDFKTGKTLQHSNVVQMGGYKWLLKDVGAADIRRAYVVLLGGKSADERLIDGKELENGEEEFKARLDDTIDSIGRINGGERMPCEVSFKCVFCSWRHLCSGV